jgi:hypothetical protein
MLLVIEYQQSHHLWLLVAYMHVLIALCNAAAAAAASTTQIAHSWSGNLVTNASWEHFWLNEGWTVFLERKIVGRLQVGSTAAALDGCYCGLKLF